METVGRFAPTPSGDVHMGNAFCYLLAWLSAKQQGGRIVLRMEDVDTPRVVAGKAQQTLDDLRWLGLTWDCGPENEVPTADFFQSARREIYNEIFEKLKNKDEVYPCFCSRADLLNASAPHAEDGHSIYPGICARLTEAQRREKANLRNPAWRIRTPDEHFSFDDGLQGHVSMNLAREYGDFAIRRADGIYCYQFAVAVDDALMGVNEVVRSRDLLLSTPQQLFIFGKLGISPPKYIHIPMILNSDGSRMAKRGCSTAIKSLREKYSPGEILGRLAFLAGQQEDFSPVSLDALLENFSWDRVPKEDIPLPGNMF